MQRSFKKSIMFLLTIMALTFNALGVTPVQATAAPPPYYPYGPQSNVDESQLAGWEVCWSSTYDSYVSLDTILTACDGDYLLLAGRPVGSTVFDVVAAAPRADVIYDTGTGNTPHNANGVGWYFSPSYSWGYAKAGDPISRSSCDTGGIFDASPNSNLRLCWHTSDNAITGGWRSGTNSSLGSNFERFIYQVSSNVYIDPSPWDFGNQNMGTTSSAKSFTLTNYDIVDLNIGTLSASAEFNLHNDLCSDQTIPASGTCTFEVTFSPISFGVISGTVSIPSDQPSTPDTLNVTGTGYNAPPVIDILSPIINDGSNLSSTIDLSDAENDPISGVLKILSSLGAPVSVTFETLETPCGGDSSVQLSLNGVVIGTVATNGTCTCNPPIDSATFTGPEIAANFSNSGSNTWTFDQASGNTSWSRVTVQYADASTQSACMFDLTGTGCITMDLCTGYQWGPNTGSATLAALNTEILSQSYTNSILPASLDISALSPGDYTLYADASDGYSSVSDTELFTLTNEPLLLINSSGSLDTTAPAVDSIVRASADPTWAASVDFTVTFSESVTGVDMSDFALTTTGITGASITNVNGSGDTYTVSVNTGSGNGTIRLDALDDDSIVDAASNPLSGGFTAGEVYTIDKIADIEVNIAGNTMGNYTVPPQSNLGQSYVGIDNGPVKVVSTNGLPIVAGLRVIWQEPGYRSSYSEMMGLPKEGLSSEYWFPWYNNLATNSMDQGFRIANVDAADTTIKVMLGATELDSFTLIAGASVRKSYAVDNGPIRIYSVEGRNIIAALRVIWKEPGYRSSYSEMIGLPKEQLSTEYWFPWYNNLSTNSMDQGFRIANVSTTEANTVEVWVGNSVTPEDTLTLAMGQSVRVGYPVDNGPIRIVCTTCTNTGSDKIIAALRVIWKEPGYRSSYSEMMGLPTEQLSNEYWFPWYNNLSTNSMDQGFRIANVDAAANTVQVWVGTTLLDTIMLAPGASTRVGYAVDNGPIRIVCTTCTNTGSDKIITALRVIWKELGIRSSYSEMMGLPTELLSTEYWFPWYNFAFPATMDQGLRISVP